MELGVKQTDNQTMISQMKTKTFTLPLPGFRALGFLGLLLACGSVRAQTWDYDYSVTRFQDLSTGDMVSQVANNYDSSVSEALPIYLGVDPDISNPISLSPGFLLDITNELGGGLVVGTPQALPPGGGGAPAMGGPVPLSRGTMVNKHSGSLTVTGTDDGKNTTGLYKADSGPGAGTWVRIAVNINQTYGPGCFVFAESVTWKGCNVALEPLANGQFSGMYAVMGGAAAWPDSSVPSFFADKTWDLVYIGDSTNAFNGSGLGQASVQCNDDEFMSVATPEFYTGCIPEPTTLALFGFGTLGLLAYEWRRRRATA